MKRLSLFALIAIPTLALAGTGVPGLERNGQPDPSEKVAHLDEQLGLDDNQEAALLKILTDVQGDAKDVKQRLRAQFEALRSARESKNERDMKMALREMDALKAEAHALRLDTVDAMRSELSVEQQVLLEELDMKRHHRMREGMERLRSSRERGPAL